MYIQIPFKQYFIVKGSSNFAEVIDLGPICLISGHYA